MKGSWVVKDTSDYILMAIEITVWPQWGFARILPSTVFLTCRDQGAGNDPESFGDLFTTGRIKTEYDLAFKK